MASEVLLVNHGIQSTIRDHRFEQIYGLMQIGANAGMHTFDESFLHLANTGYITLEEALNNARHPDELKARFQDFLRAQAAAKKR